MKEFWIVEVRGDEVKCPKLSIDCQDDFEFEVFVQYACDSPYYSAVLANFSRVTAKLVLRLFSHESPFQFGQAPQKSLLTSRTLR